jgi:hypothetical protein
MVIPWRIGVIDRVVSTEPSFLIGLRYAARRDTAIWRCGIDTKNSVLDAHHHDTFGISLMTIVGVAQISTSSP